MKPRCLLLAATSSKAMNAPSPGQGKGKVRSVRSKLAQFFNWRVMSVTYTDGVGWSMSSDCTRRQEHEGKPEGKELNRVLAS